MHFRTLRSKAKLVQETEKVSKQLEVRSALIFVVVTTDFLTFLLLFQLMMTTQSSKFMEKFAVKPELMGLAIGTHGTNICKARDIPGVTAIEVEDQTCTIKVFGDVSLVTSSVDDQRILFQ